jgi:hypothetical protein
MSIVSNNPKVFALIPLFDGWYLGGSCPHCGGKIKWIRNLMHFEYESILDIGHFECLICGENSELHRFKLEPRRK